jgi:hypothetical protein
METKDRHSGAQRRRARNSKATDRTPPEMDEFGKPKQPGVRHGIADADKVARTGSKDESVRDTPPAGAWNDVSSD